MFKHFSPTGGTWVLVRAFKKNKTNRKRRVGKEKRERERERDREETEKKMAEGGEEGNRREGRE